MTADNYLAQALAEADLDMTERENRSQAEALQRVRDVCKKWEERADRYIEVAERVPDPRSRLEIAQRLQSMAAEVRKAMAR